MFKRSEFTNHRTQILKLPAAALALFVIWADIVAAQQATISIETVEDQALGQNSWVNIMIDPTVPSFAPMYFHLVIGYSSVTPVGLQPGEIFGGCLWPVYYYTEPNSDCSFGYCPERLLHIEGYAGSHSDPDCNFSEPSILCSIKFSLQGMVGGFYPLRFVWADCSDNIMNLTPYGPNDTILISNQVYDFDGSNITASSPMFTRTGAPAECEGLMLPDSLHVRGLDFHSGGIGISYEDPAVQPRATIHITKSHGSDFGVMETLSVNLDYSSVPADSLEIAGFDFLIKYNSAALTLVSAEPGQLLQSCGWEYFNYRGDTLGLVRIVAVAEINNGDNHPLCLADTNGELATMSFMTPTQPAGYECTYLPVEFWWADCGDNAVSGPLGDTLFVSNRVYDPGPYQINANFPLPSKYGVPTECIYGTGGAIQPVRAVDYHNGGIDMKCIDSIDARGDINLNEIPYEIADWVLFSNYFFYGPGVFSVNWEAQSRASDVNVDGLELTFWDFVYLYRVIVGDALPYPSPNRAAVGDTVFLVQDTVNKTVTVNYPDSLSALMLYFDDPIFMTTTLPGHSVGGPDSFTTKVMIFPNLDMSAGALPTIADGQVLQYTGTGNLVGALAAYNGVSFLQAAVSGAGISDCCVRRGDVDNSGGLVQISDLVALVNYLFVYDNNFAPPCAEQANVDGLSGMAGPVDLSDLIYLVDYMFRMGAPIPPCPTK